MNELRPAGASKNRGARCFPAHPSRPALNGRDRPRAAPCGPLPTSSSRPPTAGRPRQRALSFLIQRRRHFLITDGGTELGKREVRVSDKVSMGGGGGGRWEARVKSAGRDVAVGELEVVTW